MLLLGFRLFGVKCERNDSACMLRADEAPHEYALYNLLAIAELLFISLYQKVLFSHRTSHESWWFRFY